MKHNFLKALTLLVFSGFLSINVIAQEGYVPSEENLENREWFLDNKYGLFVHWGVYSIM